MREKQLHIERGGLITKEMFFAYLRNELNPADKLRIEKQIAEDPFLADAVEGLKMSDPVAVEHSLDRIYSDIDIITGEKRPFKISRAARMYAVAATMILFLGLTFVIMNQLNQQQTQQSDIALEQNTLKPEAAEKENAAASDMGGGGEDPETAVDSVAAPVKSLAESTIIVNEETVSGTAVVVEKTADLSTVDFSYRDNKFDGDVITSDDETKDATELLFSSVPPTTEVNSFDTNLYKIDAPFTVGNVATANDSYGYMIEDIQLSEVSSGVVTDSKASKRESKKLQKDKNGESSRSSAEMMAVDNETDSVLVYSLPEILPQFPGGPDSLTKFIESNLTYPAAKLDAVGNVIVQFIINENGTISDAKVIQGISPGYDIEALRLVSIMPRWSPGMEHGKAVKTRYTLVVTFR